MKTRKPGKSGWLLAAGAAFLAAGIRPSAAAVSVGSLGNANEGHYTSAPLTVVDLPTARPPTAT